MAVIKGFQLKAVTNFRGHEGEPLQQANLYLQNKKVGFLSEDANGGMAQIDILPEFREQWESASQAYTAEHPESVGLSPQETLFYALFELTLNEKEYKKAIKKGYSVVAQYNKLMEYPDGRVFPSGHQIMVTTTDVADLEKYEKENWKDEKYEKHVFTSLNDFILA